MSDRLVLAYLHAQPAILVGITSKLTQMYSSDSKYTRQHLLEPAQAPQVAFTALARILDCTGMSA